MSGFFTLPASQRKRKRPETSGSSSRKRTSTAGAKRSSRKENPIDDDESIASGSDSAHEAAAATRASSEDDEADDDAGETAAERRLKLAEQYLENIRQEVGEEQEVGFDAADVDRELIAARLKEDVVEEKGRLHRYIAQRLDLQKVQFSFFRADTMATTAVASCPPHVYTASKDMRLIKWELADPAQDTPDQDEDTPAMSTPAQKPQPRRRKPKQLVYTCGNKKKHNDTTYQHHTAPILCIAASADGKFVATGGADRKLIIWEAATLNPLKIFPQHRDAVTGLAFRGKTNQLFSASKDRTVKIWSLDELAYVETLFGHQDEVVDVAAVGGTQERCVSVGARDRTARLWKVVEESQLVFRGGGAPGSSSKNKDERSARGAHKKSKPTETNGDTADQSPEHPTFNEGSLDRVLQIDTQLFVTGSDSGALSLFSLHKKKPLHVHPLAHGWDPAPSAAESSADVPVDAPINGNTTTTPSPQTNGTSHLTTGHTVTVPNPTNPHANAYNAQPTPRWITALKGIPYTDLFASGSWDGYVRIWRVTGGSDKTAPNESAGSSSSQRRIEFVGVLGGGSSRQPAAVNGDADGHDGEASIVEDLVTAPPPLRAIINDLAIFPTGSRGDDGVCVVAALGTETRLGRWKNMKGSKRANNGACVWEVPFVSQKA